jgi:hypothetical protein
MTCFLWNQKVYDCVRKSMLLNYLNPSLSHNAFKIILILSSHLRLGLPNSPYPSGFPTKIIYLFLIFPIRVIFPAHLILLDFLLLW